MLDPASTEDVAKLRSVWRKLHGLQSVRVISKDGQYTIGMDTGVAPERTRLTYMTQAVGTPDAMVHFKCGPHGWWTPIKGVKQWDYDDTSHIYQKNGNIYASAPRRRPAGFKFEVNLP